jgi:putative transposase
MSLVEQGYPVSLVCGVLDYPRSSFYYQEPADPTEQQLRQAVHRLAEQWPTYGYRRIAAMLEREGLPGGAKLVRRLMAELGLAARAPKRKVRTTNSQHSFVRYPNLVMGWWLAGQTRSGSAISVTCVCMVSSSTWL